MNYISSSSSTHFAEPTYGDVVGSDGKKTMTFLSASPSSSGTDQPNERKGVFFALSVRFSLLESAAPGEMLNDVISCKLVNLLNEGSNELVRFEDSRIVDFRDDTVSGNYGASLDVIGLAEIGVLPYAPQLGGQLFDPYQINGESASRTYGVTVLTDYALSDAIDYAILTTASVTACSATDDTATSVSAGSCAVTPSTALTSSTLVDVTLTYGTMVTSASLLVVVPTSLTITVEDTTLNAIERVAADECSSFDDEYAFQSTRVRVYADGLDVTTLATAITSTNSSVADFVVDAGGGRTDTILRGKAAGTMQVSLFPGSATTSEVVTVSADSVSVKRLVNRVITDVAWSTAPPSTFSFGDDFTASFAMSQVLTQAPLQLAGLPAHYGLLFSYIVWSDDQSEDVSGLQTNAASNSSNIIWTSPGGSDTTTSGLTIANPASDHWMVAVAPNAVRECIEESVTATFIRHCYAIYAGWCSRPKP